MDESDNKIKNFLKMNTGAMTIGDTLIVHTATVAITLVMTGVVHCWLSRKNQ